MGCGGGTLSQSWLGVGQGILCWSWPGGQGQGSTRPGPGQGAVQGGYPVLVLAGGRVPCPGPRLRTRAVIKIDRKLPCAFL